GGHEKDREAEGKATPADDDQFAAMMLAVSRQVMNSAAQLTNRHDMKPDSTAEPERTGRPATGLPAQTFVTIDGGSSPSARSSAVASWASCSWLLAKMRHWATFPGKYLSSSVSGSAVTLSRLASYTSI